MLKRKILTVLLSGLMLPFVCPANSDKELFTATTKYVDTHGETLLYTNTKGIADLVNRKIPAVVRIFTKKDAALDKPVSAAVRSVIKLINISAFKAVASSSVNTGNGIYIQKSFLTVDLKAESIFIDPALTNKTITWTNLPADTRLAFKGEINIAHAWALIKKEVNQNHPLYEIIKAASGIPGLESILSNIHGEIEFLATGTSLDNAACKLVLPDNKDVIKNFVKKEFKKEFKNDTIEIPVSDKLNITVLFKNQQVIAYTSPKLLFRAKKTLGSLPQYQKYAKLLPAKGAGYLILDIPQEVYDNIKAISKGIPEIGELMDIFLKPISIAAVTSVEKDGYLTVCAANFSFAQVQQATQFLSMVSIPAAMLLPALNNARKRARAVGCLNNLKQLGLGILMYSEDHEDYLPLSDKEIVKQAYLTPEVMKNIIYAGPYTKTKVTQIKRPSQYIIGFCNRSMHPDTLNVLYLDGHVETHHIGAMNTVEFLKSKYNLNETDTRRIEQRIKEAGEKK